GDLRGSAEDDPGDQSRGPARTACHRRAVMKSWKLLVDALALSGCALEHARTDIVQLKREDRTSLRDAPNVAVVLYPIPNPTLNGYVDQRIIHVPTQTGRDSPT